MRIMTASAWQTKPLAGGNLSEQLDSDYAPGVCDPSPLRVIRLLPMSAFLSAMDEPLTPLGGRRLKVRSSSVTPVDKQVSALLLATAVHASLPVGDLS